MITSLSFKEGQMVQKGAPLFEIKAVIAGASLYVGNDSGPAHMAAALRVPAVLIFKASDPAIWGPWRTASEVVMAPSGAVPVIDALARYGDGLPANVLPVQVNEVTQVGLEAIAASLASNEGTGRQKSS